MTRPDFNPWPRKRRPSQTGAALDVQSEYETEQKRALRALERLQAGRPKEPPHRRKG